MAPRLPNSWQLRNYSGNQNPKLGHLDYEYNLELNEEHSEHHAMSSTYFNKEPHPPSMASHDPTIP